MWNDLNVLLQAYVRGLPDWVLYRIARRVRKSSLRPDESFYDSSKQSLHIVFVSNKITARESKIAYAARRYRNRVTLITQHATSDSEMADCYDRCFIAKNPWQVLQLIGQLRPDIVHAFVHEDNLWMLPVLYYTAVPIVYDPYDCLQGMLERNHQYSRWQLIAERRWFADADRICARSLEPRYLRKQHGYRMPSTTYFPEYCWHEPRQQQPRHFSDDEELNLVYCGGIWPEDRYSPAAAGYAQYIEIGRLLAKQRIHLHLYPAAPPAGVSHEVFFALYLQESTRNHFIHIYPTLPYAELMCELPKYDAALHVLGAGINTMLGSATSAKINCSSANKLFDYIEAGLPVIIHEGRHQRGVVRHYGVSVEVHDIGQVRQALLSVLKVGHPAKLSAAIAFHAGRLDTMYRGLVK